MKRFIITEEDYIKANRKASREEEIKFFGKQINHKKIFKSKKLYSRKQYKINGD